MKVEEIKKLTLQEKIDVLDQLSHKMFVLNSMLLPEIIVRYNDGIITDNDKQWIEDMINSLEEVK